MDDRYKTELLNQDRTPWIERKIDELTKSQNEIHRKQDVLLETLNNSTTGHSIRIFNLEKDKAFYTKIAAFFMVIGTGIGLFYSKISEVFKG